VKADIPSSVNIAARDLARILIIINSAQQFRSALIIPQDNDTGSSVLR